MFVTVNGRFTTQRVTGVQRYARQVVARKAQWADVASPRNTSHGVHGHFWEQSVLPMRVGKSLLWSPCNTGPLAVRNQVVTIHDCAFYDHPEGFTRRFAAWYRWLVPRLAKRIRGIITISRFSRDRLLEYCQLPPEKITVIPQGVDPCFQPVDEASIAEVRRKLALPERYVLYVGSLAPRKNLARLLQAWKLVSPLHPDTSLVLVGAASHVFRDAGLHNLPSSVMATGYVAEDQLAAVYGGAQVLVFPSLYEGFGLPVLEAMACGTPVMTSNVTSMPEVAGDAALLVDPYSEESMADGLQKLLSDAPLRAQLAARGLARAKEFTWDRTAATTWKLLHETARDG